MISIHLTTESRSILSASREALSLFRIKDTASIDASSMCRRRVTSSLRGILHLCRLDDLLAE
ncbi:MAG: hypothetical protein AAB065_06475, partial [Deltaproteobacteria bacterium]